MWKIDCGEKILEGYCFAVSNLSSLSVGTRLIVRSVRWGGGWNQAKEQTRLGTNQLYPAYQLLLAPVSALSHAARLDMCSDG